MSTASSTGILDLRHFSARQLRPLLEAEAAVWEQTLGWDYRSATELLLQYLDSQVLSGFATVSNGEVTGFAFSVFEARKAVIGDVFAYSAFQPPAPSLDTTRELLTHLVELLRATPMIDRIESQLLLYPAGALSSLFAREGFTVHPRLFLERDLTAPVVSHGAPEPFAEPGQVLRRWKADDYQGAAGLIQTSYRGHVDARINDQYRSLHGSLRFLHNIVRFPGCGVFEAQHSWVVAEAATDRLLAIILCSRIAADVAHITQLCVLPEARGRRLGRCLLEHCATELLRAGYTALSLTVTESNAPATALYRQLGFSLRHRFDAAVLELRPSPVS